MALYTTVLRIYMELIELYLSFKNIYQTHTLLIKTNNSKNYQIKLIIHKQMNLAALPLIRNSFVKNISATALINCERNRNQSNYNKRTFYLKIIGWRFKSLFFHLSKNLLWKTLLM